MLRVMRVRDLPLFWKLLVPIVAVLVVVGAFGAFVIVRDMSSRAESALNEDLTRSSLEARALLQERELYLIESANLAANLQGMSDRVAAGDAQGVGTLLDTVRVLKTELHLVMVVDSTGNRVASLGPGGTDTANEPQAVAADSALVATVLAGDGTQKHAGFVDVGGQTLLAMAAPICREFVGCQPVGASIVAVDLGAVAATVGGPAELGVSFFDADGAELVRTKGGTDRPPAQPVALGSSEKAGATVDGADTETMYTPLLLQGEQRGSIAVTIESASVYGAVRAAGLRLALLLLIAVCAVAAVGAALSRAILAQVEPMIDTNRALGSGDLAARTPVLADDELGELARGLNAMAEQLQANNETLESRVGQRTREVERLLRDRTDFFASLSHELRTPIAIILSEAELLLDVEDGETLETGRAIRQSAVQLLAVVNDILDLAKADAKGFELDMAPRDLAQALHELQPTIDGLTRSADLESLVEVAADLPLVSADWLRLREIVINLVDNAVKYTPSGGRVHVAVKHQDDSVRVSVTDTGLGIDAAIGERLFDPFYVVQDVDPFHGRSSSGLGLSLTKGLVEAHGGEIGYESVLGQGSTFWFTLRISDASSVVEPVDEASTT